MKDVPKLEDTIQIDQIKPDGSKLLLYTSLTLDELDELQMDTVVDVRDGLWSVSSVIAQHVDANTCTCELTLIPVRSDLDALSKKVENLHIALEKKDKKIKNQAAEITALIKAKKETETFYKDCLQEQTDEYMEVLMQLNDLKAKAIDGVSIQHDNHERQMDVAEGEIKRLNVIINFLKGELYDL